MTAAIELPGMEGREAVGKYDWLRVFFRINFGRRRTGLRTTALSLAQFASADGSNAFPSLQTLARITQQGRRTVARHLALLRDVYKLIGRVSRGGGRGRRGVTSRYQLTLPENAIEALDLWLTPDYLPVAPSSGEPLTPPPPAPPAAVDATRPGAPPGRHLHLVR